MPVLINAVYDNGSLVQTPDTLESTYEYVGSHGGMACIALNEPTETELNDVAARYGLHELAVEDALLGHQRAKLERYGETLFAVLRPALYLDDVEEVQFGEVHVFVGRDFVVISIHSDLEDGLLTARTLDHLERLPEILSLGPEAILFGLLDAVVDAYQPVIDGLEQDIDQIEHALFAGQEGTSLRIYELFNEVVDFQQATRPLVGMLDGLIRGGADYGVTVELQQQFRDVRDHVIRVVERSDAFRATLQNALTLDSTIIATKQNDDTKRISAWAAIVVVPTLIAGIYGMNFQFMPELHWRFGYLFALLLMFGASVGLYLSFRRRHWL